MGDTLLGLGSIIIHTPRTYPSHSRISGRTGCGGWVGPILGNALKDGAQRRTTTSGGGMVLELQTCMRQNQ